MIVKICGITTLEDAEIVVAAGADMLGLNFVASSPRRVNVELARAVVDWVAGRLEVVGVVADLELPELTDLRTRSGVDALQLHGHEPPSLLTQLSAADFKAVRIGTAADVQRARSYPGSRLLVDAKVPGALGGTGHTFDWSLLGDLVGGRRVLLAGGLKPENVGAAVSAVRPWGVDAASGVESAVARKDRALVERFVANARG